MHTTVSSFSAYFSLVPNAVLRTQQEFATIFLSYVRLTDVMLHYHYIEQKEQTSCFDQKKICPYYMYIFEK